MRTLATYLRGLDPHLPAHGLARPGRRRRERARQRDRLPVRDHLPAQRARDLVRAGGIRAGDRRRRRAGGGPRSPGSLVDRIGGRNTLVFGLLAAARRVHALPADPRALARVRALRARGRRHGVLLARPVDAARAADAAGAPALGLCAPAREHEPRHRARRRDRRPDRDHRRPGQLHQDVPLRRRDLPRLRGRAPASASRSRPRPSPRSTRSRAATAPSCATATSSPSPG